MDGVTKAKTEALPKEGMHDGDGSDAKGGHGRGADAAKGRHVQCGRRRRRYCQRKACAMWTEALPKDGVTEMERTPMDGVTEAKVKTKAEAETRPMEAHVTETVAMVDMHDGDGGDADRRRDGDEGGW